MDGYRVKPWTLPGSYMGAHWDGWMSAGFGQSRDSNLIEQSNFAVASRALLELATETRENLPRGYEPVASTIQIVRESHWAVGWIEWIAIHPSNVEAIKLAEELCQRANDYPILDDMDLGEREFQRECDQWYGPVGHKVSREDRLRICRDAGASPINALRSLSYVDEKIRNYLSE